MNQPIRVVHIIARLNISGAAIHVALLTAQLNNDDFQSQLVTGVVGPNEGDMRYYAEQVGVTPVIIDALGRDLNPINDLKAFWQLVRFLRREKPDIVHTHTAKAGFLGRWAARVAGVPVIIHTFHGHVFKGYFGAAQTYLFLMLERLTSRITDTVITLTQTLRRELADTYHVARIEKITVLPLGFDFAPFTAVTHDAAAFREQYNIPSDAPLIGISGRMDTVKNHALFLEAAVIIRKARPAARFIMMGDGRLRDDLERQIDNAGLRGFVKITGWLRDVAPAYAAMDVFALSSINEGTPVTVIEALAVGCPVVATDVGGLRDLLEGGRYGTLVPPDNAQVLADAIIAIIDNPPDTSEAQAAIIRQYSIERLTSDMSALYRGMLTKKRGKTSKRH